MLTGRIRIERRLDEWVFHETIRRTDHPRAKTEVPPFWREEVDSRIFYAT